MAAHLAEIFGESRGLVGDSAVDRHRARGRVTASHYALGIVFMDPTAPEPATPDMLHVHARP